MPWCWLDMSVLPARPTGIMFLAEGERSQGSSTANAYVKRTNEGTAQASKAIASRLLLVMQQTPSPLVS